MNIPLFGLGQTGKSTIVSAQTRKNVYFEFQKDRDRVEYAAYGTAGTLLRFSFGDTPCRGAITVGDFYYVVHRGTFYKVNNANVRTAEGTLNTLTGMVSMATDGNTIQIVDGVKAYVYDIALDTFTLVSDPDFVPAKSNTWIDGYFITDKRGDPDVTNHNQYMWSTDGLTYNSLDFDAAETNFDPVTRTYNDNRELILFGEFTSEFHSLSGNADKIYNRQSVIEWGLTAKESVAKMNDSVIFLGRNRMGKSQVIVLNGYTPQPVSNQEFSAVLDSYGDLSNAVGYSYMLSGHPMYCISFPSVNKSWMYDGSTSLWTELTSGYEEGRNRVLFTIDFLGKTIGFDYESGNVYEISPEYLTDNGLPIIRELTSRHILSENYQSVTELWLDMEVGVGLNDGQGSDPKIMLHVSKDGGKTYPINRLMSLGKIGEYLKRCRLTRICRARDVVVKIRMSDPVKFVCMGAWMKTK